MNYEQIESNQRQQYETIRHDEEMYALRLKSDYMLFSLLQPKVYPDGNMWCVLYGENIQEGIAGFGNTIYEAIMDFNAQFHKATGGGVE